MKWLECYTLDAVTELSLRIQNHIKSNNVYTYGYVASGGLYVPIYDDMIEILSEAEKDKLIDNLPGEET